MKEFLERLGILFHLLGYISSIVNLILAIVFEEYFFILISPSSLFLGWGLRWLFTGQFVNIIPLFDIHKQAVLSVLHIPKIIKSIENPLEWWYPILGYILVGLFLIPLNDYPRAMSKWERNVFGTTCTNYDGTRTELGKYKGTETPYYCSDYPKLCDGGFNALTTVCKRYAEYKDEKPDHAVLFVYNYLKEPFFYLVVLLPMFLFYFIIRMIIYIRR
jgi:hypothetical protein